MLMEMLILSLLLRIFHCLTSFNCSQIQVWGASQLDLREQSHLPRCQPFMVSASTMWISFINMNPIFNLRIFPRFISGRKASPSWVSPTKVATEETSRLLSSYSRWWWWICCWWWGWWPWRIWRNKVSLSSLFFNVSGLIIELLDQWNSLLLDRDYGTIWTFEPLYWTRKTWKYLNSSTFRLNMPAKDKAVVKCVASILVTTAMSSWLLLLIIIKLWQTSFWQSEDVVIKQQEPPMAPVNMIFILLFSPFALFIIVFIDIFP